MATRASAKYFQPEVLSRIGRLELRARHVVEGFISGMHASPYRGFSVEFANHRAYVPGDDIRRIDWRVYAKADRYFVKEYEEETNVRAHLVLDCSASMAYPDHPGTGRMTKWDYAATLAASMGHLLVGQGDGVGLTLFDHQIRAQVPVSSNRASLLGLGKVIEDARPTARTSVKMLFQELAAAVPRRGMVVILSDLLTDPEDVIRGLQRLRYARHDVLVLHVLDHDELEFRFSDRTRFEGMEDPELEVLSDPQSLRQSYLDALNEFTSRLRRACLDQKIEYALVSTADRLDIALTTFLTTRMHSLRARA
jgi:uncharacterized protein (DUF58 family)